VGCRLFECRGYAAGDSSAPNDFAQQIPRCSGTPGGDDDPRRSHVVTTHGAVGPGTASLPGAGPTAAMFLLARRRVMDLDITDATELADQRTDETYVVGLSRTPIPDSVDRTVAILRQPLRQEAAR
jgi:hypothetical protein